MWRGCWRCGSGCAGYCRGRSAEASLVLVVSAGRPSVFCAKREKIPLVCMPASRFLILSLSPFSPPLCLLILRAYFLTVHFWISCFLSLTESLPLRIAGRRAVKRRKGSLTSGWRGGRHVDEVITASVSIVAIALLDAESRWKLFKVANKKIATAFKSVISFQ